jgi:hypothetical protein
MRGLEARCSFLDPPRSARGTGRLDAIYGPSERLREFVDRVPHVRHRRHKLVSAIPALQICGPMLASGRYTPPPETLLFFLLAHLEGTACTTGSESQGLIIHRWFIATFGMVAFVVTEFIILR